LAKWTEQLRYDLRECSMSKARLREWVEDARKASAETIYGADGTF
jgi:hypothetical protein